MRRGRLVGEAALPCPTEHLVEMMFGRVMSPPQKEGASLGEPVLVLEGVRPGERTAAEYSLSVREGEVVGLPGSRGAASAPSCAPAPVSPAGSGGPAGGRA